MKITLEDLMKGYPKDTVWTRFTDIFRYKIPAVYSNYKYEIRMMYQLITKGYNNRQIYEFKSEMAELHIKLLTEFNKTKCGYPSGLNDVKWTEILDTIIDGFKAQQELNDMWEYDKKLEAKLLKRWNKGMELYTKWYGNLWD